MSVAAVKKSPCLVCRKHAHVLACGHAFHLKCMPDKKNCGSCGALARHSAKQQCDHLPGATQRMTTGVNGNAFISVTQQDAFGRTTITREIFKETAPEYAQLARATPMAQCQGNLGLLFMKTLMGEAGGAAALMGSMGAAGARRGGAEQQQLTTPTHYN